jgi:hypothetical protein
LDDDHTLNYYDQKNESIKHEFPFQLFKEPPQTLMSGNDLALPIMMLGASSILPDALPSIMGRGLTIP